MTRETVVYRDEDHTYWMGDRQLPSVTQLLKKHGISADLSGAPEEVLRRAGEHGTFVHEEIENYIKTGELGISDEFQDFMKLVEPLADVWLSEVMIWTEDYAGRVDLIGITDDEILVVDTKTGQVVLNPVAWQTSMYGFAFPNEAKKRVRCFVFDAKPNGASRLIELDKVPDDCINGLIEAEKAGEIYSPVGKLMAENQEKALAVEKAIADAEAKLKAMKADRDKFWNQVKEGMEKGRITSFECPSFRVAYVAPYDRITVDSERLKKLYPQAYADCQKASHTKASLRVTLGEEKA